MAYCTAEEALEGIKEDMQNSIIGDEYIEDPEEKAVKIMEIAIEAVDDAAAEIDGYLAKRYALPFTKTPKVLNKFCKDIAVYNMVSRMGIDEDGREKSILTRYESAIKFLEKVAKGIINVGADSDNNATAASTGFQLSSSPRLFRRENMNGW